MISAILVTAVIVIFFIIFIIISFGQRVVRPLAWPSELKKTEMHKFERKQQWKQ